MTARPPARTADQRRAAAAESARVRAAHAEVRAALRGGRLTPAQVLRRAADDPALGSLRVGELVGCLPGLGPARVTAALRELGIAPSRRLRGLGPRQRSALAEFDPRGAG